MQEFEKLLLGNKAWAQDMLELDEHFFEDMAADQSPGFLWIGCSDSRVHSNEITGTLPGEMFVHRNIANLVVTSDLNLLSVLQYAVEVLKVKNVIVCGHYECGGVKAAMSDKKLGLIDHWLQNIKNVKQKYKEELNRIADEHDRFDRLVELNVQEQVFNLARTPIIQGAWQQLQQPSLHGWVFDLRTGLLKQVIRLSPEDASAVEMVRELGNDQHDSLPATDIRLL